MVVYALHFTASKRLSDLIRRPYDLYRAGVMDEYLMGLMNQVAQAMDDSITQEVCLQLHINKNKNLLWMMLLIMYTTKCIYAYLRGNFLPLICTAVTNHSSLRLEMFINILCIYILILWMIIDNKLILPR